MFNGALIMESLKVGTRLRDLNIKISELYRFQPKGTASYQPDTWTILELEIEDDDAPQIAESFAGALSEPGLVCRFPVPLRDLHRVPRPGLPLPQG
jgi:hypothetical protein